MVTLIFFKPLILVDALWLLQKMTKKEKTHLKNSHNAIHSEMQMVPEKIFKNTKMFLENAHHEVLSPMIIGLAEGLTDVSEMLAHPYDHLIYPILLVAFDVGVLILHHPNLKIEKGYLKPVFNNNQEMYGQSYQRMSDRINHFVTEVKDYVQANSKEKIRKTSRLATNIYVPGTAIKALKNLKNIEISGQLNPAIYIPRRTPVLERYKEWRSEPIKGTVRELFTEILDDWSTAPHEWLPTMGEAAWVNIDQMKYASFWGTKEFSYVFMRNGEFRAIRSSNTFNSELCGGHYGLTLNKPILMGGDIVVRNGKILKIDNRSGDYTPYLEKQTLRHGMVKLGVNEVNNPGVMHETYTRKLSHQSGMRRRQSIHFTVPELGSILSTLLYDSSTLSLDIVNDLNIDVNAAAYATHFDHSKNETEQNQVGFIRTAHAGDLTSSIIEELSMPKNAMQQASNIPNFGTLVENGMDILLSNILAAAGVTPQGDDYGIPRGYDLVFMPPEIKNDMRLEKGKIYVKINNGGMSYITKGMNKWFELKHICLRPLDGNLPQDTHELNKLYDDILNTTTEQSNTRPQYELEKKWLKMLKEKEARYARQCKLEDKYPCWNAIDVYRLRKKAARNFWEPIKDFFETSLVSTLEASEISKVTKNQRDAVTLYWTKVLNNEIPIQDELARPMLAYMRKTSLNNFTKDNPDWMLKFMNSLDEVLREAMEHGDNALTLILDYEPQGLLRKAAEKADIPFTLFPAGKLRTSVDDQDNMIVNGEKISTEKFFQQEEMEIRDFVEKYPSAEQKLESQEPEGLYNHSMIKQNKEELETVSTDRDTDSMDRDEIRASINAAKKTVNIHYDRHYTPFLRCIDTGHSYTTPKFVKSSNLLKKDGTYLYVIKDDGTLIFAEPKGLLAKHSGSKITHKDLARGETLMAAGHIVVKNGAIINIDDHAPNYEMNADCFSTNKACMTLEKLEQLAFERRRFINVAFANSKLPLRGEIFHRNIEDSDKKLNQVQSPELKEKTTHPSAHDKSSLSFASLTMKNVEKQTFFAAFAANSAQKKSGVTTIEKVDFNARRKELDKPLTISSNSSKKEAPSSSLHASSSLIQCSMYSVTGYQSSNNQSKISSSEKSAGIHRIRRIRITQPAEIHYEDGSIAHLQWS